MLERRWSYYAITEKSNPILLQVFTCIECSYNKTRGIDKRTPYEVTSGITWLKQKMFYTLLDYKQKYH